MHPTQVKFRETRIYKLWLDGALISTQTKRLNQMNGNSKTMLSKSMDGRLLILDLIRAAITSRPLPPPPLVRRAIPAHIWDMLKFTPILLALVWAYVMVRFSAWKTARELDAKSTRLADPKLQALMAKLATALDLPSIKLHIYEISPVNGLAAPDGRIFITRGFFDRYRQGDVTAEELCSVVAHELGHVALGHARRRMIDFSGQNAIRTALGMVLGRFLPGIGYYIASLLTNMLAARLSRQDEHEADAYASALLVKAGFGVEPQKTLFAKLDLLARNGTGQPAWLMSHPKTADRIREIEARQTRWNT